MPAILKQYQGSVVSPEDDAKVYKFLGGISGIVSGCAVTLYATNQLKVSSGWGFACGRVFTIEEEVIVAVTTAAKGRALINIDLENVAEPARLTTQSAAVLPALVQEDINADGTVFQLALSQYDIASNTISNLTDVRVMLYSIDSRISALENDPGGLELGETSTTAYYGDKGKTAYDHSQVTGNPHGTTASVITQDSSNRFVTDTEKSTWNAKQSALTFDSAPTDSSSNPVTSNGVYDALAAKADIAQKNWIAPTFLNSWVNVGGGYYTAGYYKDSIGIVHLRGLIKGGTTTAGTDLLQLPVGYRPAKHMFFPAVSNYAYCAIQVLATGIVELGTVASATWIDLSSISFRAEA